MMEDTTPIFSDELDWIREVSSTPVILGSHIFVGSILGSDEDPDLLRLLGDRYRILVLDGTTDLGEIIYRVISNSDLGIYDSNRSSVTIQWAEHLFDTGYWRLLSHETPRELLNSTSPIEKEKLIPYVISFKNYLNL